MVTHGRDDSVNSRTRHVQDKKTISQFTFIKLPRSRPSSSNLTATFLSRLAQRPARVSSRRQGRIFNCFPLVRVSLVGSRGDADRYNTSFTAGRRPSRGHTLRSPFAHQRRGRPRVPRSSCGDRHLPRSAQCRGGSERIRDPGWRAPSSRAPPPAVDRPSPPSPGVYWCSTASAAASANRRLTESSPDFSAAVRSPPRVVSYSPFPSPGTGLRGRALCGRGDRAGGLLATPPLR